MIAWLNAYISYIRWIVILLGLAVVFWAGRHWGWLEEQNNKAEVQAANNALYRASAAKSHTIGMNLETGLNDYRKNTKDIHHANNDSSGVFDVGSVRSHTDRIAAGTAARKRVE